MLLWFLMLVLCSAATVAIAFPLIRHYKARDARAESAAVYLDQLKEIDRDLMAGAINEPEAKLAKVEIERRLAAATRDVAPSRPLSPFWRNVALTAVVCIVIIGSVSLYAKLGHPTMPSAASDGMAVQQDQMAMILGMVRKQAEELRTNPKDMEGWIRLMRSLQVLNEPDKARAALSFALKAFDGDAPAVEKLKAAASDLNIN